MTGYHNIRILGHRYLLRDQRTVDDFVIQSEVHVSSAFVEADQVTGYHNIRILGHRYLLRDQRLISPFLSGTATTRIRDLKSDNGVRFDGCGLFALGGAQVGPPFRAIAALGFTRHVHALTCFVTAAVVFQTWIGLAIVASFITFFTSFITEGTCPAVVASFDVRLDALADRLLNIIVEHHVANLESLGLEKSSIDGYRLCVDRKCTTFSNTIPNTSSNTSSNTIPNT